MKILGSTQNGFLLEVTENEIALIQGFRNTYTDKYRTPNVGAVIDISKIDRISRFVRTLDQDKLQGIKSNLKSAIADIDEAVDMAQSITLFATLEDDDAKEK
jgi:hypothetical protein